MEKITFVAGALAALTGCGGVLSNRTLANYGNGFPQSMDATLVAAQDAATKDPVGTPFTIAPSANLAGGNFQLNPAGGSLANLTDSNNTISYYSGTIGAFYGRIDLYFDVGNAPAMGLTRLNFNLRVGGGQTGVAGCGTPTLGFVTLKLRNQSVFNPSSHSTPATPVGLLQFSTSTEFDFSRDLINVSIGATTTPLLVVSIESSQSGANANCSEVDLQYVHLTLTPSPAP